MIKTKNLKKILSIVMVFAFVVSIVPAKVPSSEATETTVSSDNQMLHFVMKVRWGNVIGDQKVDPEEPEPTTDEQEVIILETETETEVVTTAKTFDGSISVSSNARVSLERTLLFERHNNTSDSNAVLAGEISENYVADKIINFKDPVSWNSLIYGHWDGVKVLVSSPADSTVTITTAKGNVEMTAQEFYDLNKAYIKDVGEGNEIVVKIYPIKDPKYFLKVLWGRTSRADYAIRSEEGSEMEISDINVDSASSAVIANSLFRKIVNNISWHDASGSFKINSGGILKLVRPLRFERNDKILSSPSSQDEIVWTSYVAQGVDGILTKLELDANSLDSSDTVTINFTKADWSKSFKIIDLYHNRRTLAEVAEGYGVILQVWKRPNRSLIRVKGGYKVYIVEDGVKQWIPSPQVLESQGLSFDDVEDVDQDEADTYGDAEEVCYADGSIVKESDKNEVYVIADGEKKHITDPTAFAALGYNWNNVVVVKPGALGFYRLRTSMKLNSVHPEGALIREKGTNTVYLIEGGKKKPISSLNIFNARRLNWNKVLVISNAQMKKFQLGTTLRYPDGALISINGKVYVMDKGEKRWVRSGDDLTGAGYSADDVIKVTDTTEVADLETTPEGYDIIADDDAVE